MTDARLCGDRRLARRAWQDLMFLVAGIMAGVLYHIGVGIGMFVVAQCVVLHLTLLDGDRWCP
jgi:hypothetical protein